MSTTPGIYERVEMHGGAFVDSMVTDQAAFYDLRADIYDEQNESLERAERREAVTARYHRILPDILPARISYVDFGCGTGTATYDFLTGLGSYTEISTGAAIDISTQMLRHARQNLPGFILRQGGVEQLDFVNVDLITAFYHVLGHLSDSDIGLFFKNASKGLRKGGALCFEVAAQLEVGEHNYTQDDADHGRKYLAYATENKDGSKIRGNDGKLIIGTERMFKRDEITNLAEDNGLAVVGMEELVVAHPDERVHSFREIDVVLQKA